jgi:hypothetical protein
MRPFFSFYGGKWRDAPRNYPPPVHDAIIEPFAGSAGYSLRYPARRVTLYDTDPVIAGLWAYLIRVRESEIRAISDVPEGGTVEDLGLSMEASWLVGFWLNKGCSAPRRRPSSWMRSGIRPGSFWGSRVRETIAQQLAAIRHWSIVHGSYEAADDVEATWFVDPPYQDAGKHYVKGSDSIDFAALGSWCRSRRGQVIACENVGADWLPFSPLSGMKTTRKGKRSHEAMWLSPSGGVG